MHIVSTQKLRAFAEEVLRLEPSGWTSEVDPDQIRVLMGERLDIWPWSIFVGAEDDEDDERADEALA